MRTQGSFLLVLLLSMPALGQTAGQRPPVAINPCRFPPGATVTFRYTLPASPAYDVIAAVELVELVDARVPSTLPGCGPHASRIKVRVVDAIKGTKRGDVFVVDAGGNSDDQWIGLDSLGETVFIAGRFVTDRDQRIYFSGQHKLPLR